MTDDKKLQVKVVGDAGGLILGSKPQVIPEPNSAELGPICDFDIGD